MFQRQFPVWLYCASIEKICAGKLVLNKASHLDSYHFVKHTSVRYINIFIACLTAVSCQHPKGLNDLRGNFVLNFAAGKHSIPARLAINDKGAWAIQNAEETITLDSIVFRSDSFFIQMPLFDSDIQGVLNGDSLVGVWTDHSRKDYHIPFVGKRNEYAKESATPVDLRYRITLSPSDSAASSGGIAKLVQRGKVITGTVLTETGDYRYLEGELNGEKLWLSAFDGTHLFYLNGTLRGDSILDGVFLSGKHWQETWVGIKDTLSALRDPYSITQCNTCRNPEFHVLNEKGEQITFDSADWKNRVSIIQIMGSWCPNCTDESRYFKTLFEKHHNQGLQIIPVAFERGDDIAAAALRVRKQFDQLGLEYPFYYGGKSGKNEALQTLSFLREVNSFPTSIFIDKSGEIRKIYTGFYGPGTGQAYTTHCASINALVDSLIRE